MTNLDCGVALANCELLELLRTNNFQGPRYSFSASPQDGLGKRWDFKAKKALGEDPVPLPAAWHAAAGADPFFFESPGDKIAENKAEFRVNNCPSFFFRFQVLISCGFDIA